MKPCIKTTEDPMFINGTIHYLIGGKMGCDLHAFILRERVYVTINYINWRRVAWSCYI